MLFLTDCLETFCQWSGEGNAKPASHNHCTITACGILTSSIKAVDICNPLALCSFQGVLEALTLDANGIGVHSWEDRENVSIASAFTGAWASKLLSAICPNQHLRMSELMPLQSALFQNGRCRIMQNRVIIMHNLCFLGMVNRLQPCSSLHLFATFLRREGSFYTNHPGTCLLLVLWRNWDFLTITSSRTGRLCVWKCLKGFQKRTDSWQH